MAWEVQEGAWGKKNQRGRITKKEIRAFRETQAVR